MWNKDSETAVVIAIQHKTDITTEISIVPLMIYYNPNFDAE